MRRSTRVSMAALILVLLFSIHSIDAKRQIPTKDITKVTRVHNGDTYDCVDFYKQPAFDHPLLANHTFHHEMKPSPIPEMTRFEIEISANDTEVQFKGIGCPVGTVPIRQRRLNSAKYGSKYIPPAGTHYAGFRTRWDGPNKYYGGGTGISIWNPSVGKDQFSSGELVIRNYNDNIQVGWTVNPNLYGDSQTRLFIYTGSDTTGCFNLDCPGFVLTNKDIALDEVFKPSTSGGPTYFIKVFVYKETPGHWWLRAGRTLNAIGFWPSNIFTSLAETAATVVWGGHVAGPPYELSAPMGSGEYLSKNTKYDAYCKFVQVVTEEHTIVDATEDVETFVDNSHYQVAYLGVREKSYGNLVVWGGPGNITDT